MKAFAKLAAAVLALAAPIHLAGAQGPAGSLRPSEPPAIVAAAQSCRDAVTPEGLDDQRLLADGWARGQLSSNGRNVESPLRMFGRGSIVLFAAPGAPGCILTARIRDMSRYPQVIAAMIAVFGRPYRTAENAPTIWFFEGGRLMQAEAAGSADRPAIRIAIIYHRSSQ
jgi:hypothetical protein